MNAPTNAARLAHALTCSCGLSFGHVIAERETADGAGLRLWSDGALTGSGGYAFPGVPIVRARTAEAARVALAAGWLAADEAGLYDADEIPALYAAARRLVARNPSAQPGDLRAAMADRGAPHIPIRWEVLQADNRGATTCRVGILPRLMWAGVGVWHERGRYEIMHAHTGTAFGAHSRESWHGTGITFTSQRELFRYLAANPTRTVESA